MDPPSDLSADSIRDEKVKVLKALRPITPENMETHLVRGQYTAGNIKGKAVPGYLDEEGAVPGSTTETFVAIKAELANWRWAGFRFICAPESACRKILADSDPFQTGAHYIFDPDQKHIANNKLIIRLQPDEGISCKYSPRTRARQRYAITPGTSAVEF